MKNLITLVFLCLSLALSAQLTSGKIVFEETVDLHAKLPPQAQQFKDMIPQYKTQKTQLLFTPELSKYSVIHEEEEAKTRTGDGIRIEMRGMKDNSETVHDISNNSTLEFKEFMGRTFLIEDEGMKNLVWKIGMGQREILGYVCQEAVYYGKEDTLLAWFSPQIPVSTGPRGYGKLPGMILAMESMDGFLSVEAKEIHQETPDKSAMKISGSGKKMTREEFDQVVEEKKKEMMEANGGGGMVIKMRR
ncbi:MAG: GLPGLI family protein [Luteibaculum sp.]